MVQVVLSIGSNLDRNYVVSAINWLRNIISNPRFSGIYTTPSIHGTGDPYVNAVVIGKTRKSFEELNQLLKDYEKEQGRDNEARERGIVPIDIDIVIWNAEVVRPRDYCQKFFQIGFLELTCPVI